MQEEEERKGHHRLPMSMDWSDTHPWHGHNHVWLPGAMSAPE